MRRASGNRCRGTSSGPCSSCVPTPSRSAIPAHGPRSWTGFSTSCAWVSIRSCRPRDPSARLATSRRCRTSRCRSSAAGRSNSTARARPHPGQIAVAAELRRLLLGSGLQASHHASHHKIQDPYSIRCIPQVHGAVRDALDYLLRVLDVELNAATDNPLVFPGGGVADASTLATGGGLVISGGNFHGEPIALALDFAKLAISELASFAKS